MVSCQSHLNLWLTFISSGLKDTGSRLEVPIATGFLTGVFETTKNRRIVNVKTNYNIIDIIKFFFDK